MSTVINGSTGINKVSTSASLADENMPAGSVLQVVDAGAIDSLTFTNVNTANQIGSLNITPKYASSKIMLFANIQIANGSNGSFVCSIRSGSSDLMVFSEHNTAGRSGTSGILLHSPNTTNSVEYNLAVKKEGSNSGFTAVINTGHNHLYALEIKQ